MDTQTEKIYPAKDVYIAYLLAVLPGILFILIGIFDSSVMFAGIIIAAVGLSFAIGYMLFLHSIRLIVGSEMLTYTTAIVSSHAISFVDVSKVSVARTGKMEDFSHEFILFGKTAYTTSPFIVKLKYFKKEDIQEIASAFVTKCLNAEIDPRVKAFATGDLSKVHET